MRSSVSLTLLLAACSNAPAYPGGVSTPPLAAVPEPPAAPNAQVPLPPELAAAEGPSGTAGAGNESYDAVGYASWYGEELSGNRTATGERFDPAAITAAHRTLPLGSIAEVTSLDTGRTILVRINDRGPARTDREIDLSRGAADQLGAQGAIAAVRVRGIVASPADLVALRAGQRAAPRLDAPPALLAALRKELTPKAVSSPAPVHATVTSQVAPVERPAPSISDERAATGRYLVQVATFSTEARAKALARTLGGSVQRAGALWRVRTGPYRDLAGAKRGRDAAARRGYGDAHILTDP